MRLSGYVVDDDEVMEQVHEVFGAASGNEAFPDMQAWWDAVEDDAPFTFTVSGDPGGPAPIADVELLVFNEPSTESKSQRRPAGPPVQCTDGPAGN